MACAAPGISSKLNISSELWERGYGHLPPPAELFAGPEEIAVLTDAYERTLRELQLVDRNDPITDMIAKKVIELGQRGVREAQQLSALAIKELGVE
jgi:hypothetical protein